MSDTPRTDEALSYNVGYQNYQLEQVEKVSRILERELTKAQEEIARMRRVVSGAIEAKKQGLLPMYLDIAVGDYEAGEKP